MLSKYREGSRQGPHLTTAVLSTGLPCGSSEDALEGEVGLGAAGGGCRVAFGLCMAKPSAEAPWLLSEHN